MSDPKYQPTTNLKRVRPKTPWVWYITAAVSAFLLMGITVSYAMQQSHLTNKHTANTKKPVAVHHFNKAIDAKDSGKKISKTKVKPAVAAITPDKKQTTNSPSTTPIKQEIPTKESVKSIEPETKKHSKTNHPHPTQTTKQADSRQEITISVKTRTEIKTPTVSPTPSTPTPSAPKPSHPENNPNPISNLLNQVTSTVRNLLVPN